jgi:DNA-binding beta-propeller fold protein YncE
MKNIYKLISLSTIIIGWFLAASGCEKNSSDANGSGANGLTLLFETTLNFGEPSGVAFSKSMNKLWIVSGGDQHVYMVDTSGAIQKKLSFIGTDLEGITFDPIDSTLWVVDEATKMISHLSLDGTLLRQVHLSYATQTLNKGPEGITIGENKSFCVINEKDPSIIVKMNSNFDILSIDTLNFAQDYSDIWYVSADTFLIVSDESEAVYLWSKSKGIIKKYLLPNTKNEGIALDEQNNIAYVVNDANAKLYCYRLDTTVVN